MIAVTDATMNRIPTTPWPHVLVPTWAGSSPSALQFAHRGVEDVRLGVGYGRSRPCTSHSDRGPPGEDDQG